MSMYSAYVEVATPSVDLADTVLEELSDYHPAVSYAPRGWLGVQMSLPAETLRQATQTALTLVSDAAGGAEPIVCHVMTETEFNVRQGWEAPPDLLSTREAAELLGISRQRVQQLAEAGQLPYVRIGGAGLAFPRPAVEARRGTMARETI